MEPIIQVKNLSKKYKINHERGGYISLRDVLMNVIRKPFSYAKNKAKSVVGLEKKEDFWALNDVSFNINKGEVIGIIGKNGAGKSTLLKILTQITEPTKGEIIMRGTVGSLLEVGTGFHPELTGRENIFLNGAILGMSKKEIASKFDRIVEFAGIEKFLDTPVKRYSSGMYVRLAFSVAAHMEPDILLVDEVLAVGDTEFQKKCLGKMEEVTQKDGRTIIFVSHNLSAIERLCKKTILLEKGNVVKIGDTKDVINEYIKAHDNKAVIDIENEKGDMGPIRLESITLNNRHDDKFSIVWNEPIDISLKFDSKEKIENIRIGVTLRTFDGDVIFTTRNTDLDSHVYETIEKGKSTVRLKINHNLRAGYYFFGLGIALDKGKNFFDPNLAKLEIHENNDPKYIAINTGIINVKTDWSIQYE